MLGYDSFEELSSHKDSNRGRYHKRGLQYSFNEFEHKNSFVEETVLITKDKKELYVRENAHVMRDNEGSIICYEGTIEDMTDKKSIEQELLSAKDKAEQSDKLKSEFLAQISHEIRTPINTILNFTGLMYEELQHGSNEDIETYHSMTAMAGHRLIRTIDLILNMAQLQSGAYELHIDKINLSQSIVNIIRDYKYQATAKELELTCELPEKNIFVQTDEYLVNQVFVNLIDNAMKFTDEGSVTVRLVNVNNSLLFEVEDTGIGISEDYLPRLFKPFTQETQGYTRSYDGNGLGLALVKKYCDINNLRLEVKSQKGKGSCFSVYFNDSHLVKDE